MLVELNCDKFIEPKIIFNENLNIVLGDNNASNSIGKSTFLMIIDFIMGGKTYLEHNKDVFENIGEHDFFYTFKFNGKFFKFKMEASFNGAKIYLCDENYIPLEEISKEKYTDFLKKEYDLDDVPLSFRGIISLFFRIWGKKNYTIDRPLHTVPNTANYETINNLIKLYQKYSSIFIYEKEKKKLEDKEKALKKSFKEGIIEKITQKQYLKNEKRIFELEGEKQKLEKNRFNVESKILNEISNAIFSLKLKKSDLILKKDSVNNSLLKIQNKKIKKTNLNKEEINKLREYFPEINETRISEIENFSKKINIILRDEIETRIFELKNELIELEKNLENTDHKLEELSKDLGESSKTIVNKITDIVVEIQNLEKQNENHKRGIQYKEKIEKNETELKDKKIEILDEISKILNENIKNINERINPEKNAPTIKLFEKDYIFEVANNTGTGKGYENLIIFDLSVLKTTVVPMLIHDSFLFKNIEIDVMENIIDEYLNYNKQIFIAIDELKRYKIEKQNLIKSCTILELKKEKVLFGKEWSKEKK